MTYSFRAVLFAVSIICFLFDGWTGTSGFGEQLFVTNHQNLGYTNYEDEFQREDVNNSAVENNLRDSEKPTFEDDITYSEIYFCPKCNRTHFDPMCINTENSKNITKEVEISPIKEVNPQDEYIQALNKLKAERPYLPCFCKRFLKTELESEVSIPLCPTYPSNKNFSLRRKEENKVIEQPVRTTKEECNERHCETNYCERKRKKPRIVCRNKKCKRKKEKRRRKVQICCC